MAKKPATKTEFKQVGNTETTETKKESKKDKKNIFTLIKALLSYELVKGLKDAYFNVKQTKTEIDEKGEEKKVEVPYPYDVTKLKITETMLHALSRNVRIFKKAVTKQTEMYEDFQESFKKKFGFDEDKFGKDKDYQKEFNDAYLKFLDTDENKEIRKKLWESEFKEEIFYIEKSTLDACILPDDIYDQLESILVKKEEESGKEKPESEEETDDPEE